MKIDRVDTLRLAEYPNLTFVEIYTDDGLVGTGETFYGAEAVEAHLHSTAIPMLLGEDPLRIDEISRRLSGYVGYSGSGAETRARSAVDIALWDLRARSFGVPLHDTMGGRTRESIRVYNTCAGSQYVRRSGQSSSNWGLGAQGPYEDLERSLNDAGGLAEELLSEGITGMKIWPFDRYAEASLGTHISSADLRAGLEPLAKVRAAVGDQMDVMIEMHALWSVPAARSILHALADLAPYWVEDPVRSDVLGGLVDLAGTATALNILVAAGETVAQLGGFAQYLCSGAIDVATVDLSWGGGLTEAVRIAALAASAGRMIAPHDCTGPIALAAATHLSVSATNALVQETVRSSLRGWHGDLVTDLPTVREGAISPPVGIGLGTALQPNLRQRPGAMVRSSVAR
jgi:galactonate dehydratase